MSNQKTVSVLVRVELSFEFEESKQGTSNVPFARERAVHQLKADLARLGYTEARFIYTDQ